MIVALQGLLPDIVPGLGKVLHERHQSSGLNGKVSNRRKPDKSDKSDIRSDGRHDLICKGNDVRACILAMIEAIQSVVQALGRTVAFCLSDRSVLHVIEETR